MNRSIPLVSVIIPTYKRTETKRAVDSALTQDYPNIEIIVVDDNAEYPEFRRGVLESLAEYISSGKITLLQNEKNLGGALSRNEGIKASSGEYIAFLDDDDLFLPGKISKQVDALAGSDAAMVYCFCVGKDSEGNVLWENNKNKEGNLLFEAMTECIAGTPTIMVKRDMLFLVGLFSDVPCKQDVLLELKITSAGGKIICVPEVLVSCGCPGEHEERISKISQRTLIGFSAVRDYARENYDKITSAQRKEVEMDTSYKMCRVAKQLGDRQTVRAELRNMIRHGFFDVRVLKVIVKCLV